MKKVILLSALILNSGIAFAATDTASWASWSGTTGNFVQNGNSITVTYTGQYNWIDYAAAIFNDVPISFTNSIITNTPGSNGTIAMTGGDAGVSNFHFFQAVIDPLIAIWSVGQNGLPVTFSFNTPFTILSSGGGHWGGGTLIQNDNSVTGYEGNGLLQFLGSYNDIAFTTPNYEYYYGITVGNLTSAVPEPEVYLMLLMGLGWIGFSACCRKYAAI